MLDTTEPGRERKSQLIRRAEHFTDRLSREERAGVLEEALATAGYSHPAALARELLANLRQLQQVNDRLQRVAPPGRLPLVVGPLDERLFILPAGDRDVLCSLGRPLGARAWPAPGLTLSTPAAADSYVSVEKIDNELRLRLGTPHVKLVSLYHPEVFPLPRVALGISDIARALRRQMIGRVTLADMQLGRTLPSVLEEVLRERPDIIGISATFGQEDILDDALEQLRNLQEYRPLVVLGGSLCALNAQERLRKNPAVLIAMGPGELTMQQIVRFWWGEIPVGDVPDLSYISEDGTYCRTRGISNRDFDDILPELDLLDPTLACNGVMQLESSRGCSYACSFCPRDHKGIWTGDDPSSLRHILPEIGAAFELYPHIARKIFLVDEEFIGYRPDAESLTRVLEVSRSLNDHGFTYETSSRIDQVYRPNRDKTWHVTRMDLWKELCREGLDRCLFGVESGVDSILRRFNKKSTSEQNALAVRILTACGVPIRCTYITFDPLMSMQELVDTYRFQGRRDVLINPQPELPSDELFDLLHDETWVASNTTGHPFHHEITYMLVSIECLIGSKYLADAEQAGLAGKSILSMGKRETRYLDPRIGLMSYYGQCWVDRNFSFDYSLKSIEKVSPRSARHVVREYRAIIKRASYEVLGSMIALATGDGGLIADSSGEVPTAKVKAAIRASTVRGRLAELDGSVIEDILDTHFDELRSHCERYSARLEGTITVAQSDLLAREFNRWQGRSGWALINAA